MTHDAGESWILEICGQLDPAASLKLSFNPRTGVVSCVFGPPPPRKERWAFRLDPDGATLHRAAVAYTVRDAVDAKIAH